MGNIFLNLTIILCIATFLTLIFRLLKQPAILAYVLTGVILGQIGFFNLDTTETLHSLSEIGITLLLFMLGLELRLNDLKSVGKIALLTGIGQIFFTSIIGFFIAMLLGFSTIASVYISIALTFSSTIIIVKLLSDKKDLKSLYGRISIGFLLIQDFFAIVALILLSGLNNSSSEIFSLGNLGAIVLKGAILFAAVIYLSKTLLPKLVDKVADSIEVLFLFSIAWAFGISLLVSSPLVGFTIEIGGFLAGIALANSTESFQIISRVKSLRDFFITIFFVNLGASLVFADMIEIWVPALIFSGFILIGNPIIVMAIMGFLGYRKRTSFLAGLTVAQISEFSLIVIFLGSKIGHLPNNVVSLVTLVGVITFTISTYMILGGNKLYKLLQRPLSIFERKHVKSERIVLSEEDLSNLDNHAVLIGGDQMGQSILDLIQEENRSVVVIDSDPDILKKLEHKKVHRLFGDVSDLDIQERANLNKAKLVISTVPDLDDNLMLLRELKQENQKAKIIVMALDSHDARILYSAGADYVVLPHLAGGKQIAEIIKNNRLDDIESLKVSDWVYLS